MAKRVSPSGNLSSGPSEIQLLVDGRVKLDKAYPRSGTPTSAPAMTFNPAPILRSRSRRDDVDCDDVDCADAFASFARAAFLQGQSEFGSLMASLFLFGSG